MTKLFVNKIKSFILKYWILLFLLGTTVYFVSCLTVNFVVGKTWYNPDMCMDALVSELMADEMTLFPSDWTFGNQYYIIATPVLGAFFSLFIDNGFYAMGLASSVMMCGIYVSYLWCLKPFVSRKVLIVGLFLLSGSMIFGTSACDYVYGFQLLYTMCSYYACYVIGGFLTLGLFFRIYKQIPFNKVWFAVIGLVNFALGMHSLRQTLVFDIPLVAVAFYLCLFKKEKWKQILFFSVGVLISNGLGIAFIKLLAKTLSINTHKLIEGIQFHTDIAILKEHLSGEMDNLYKITGLYFWEYIKVEKIFVIIVIGAVFTILCAVTATVIVLINRDTSPLAIAVLWCFTSLFLVFAVGIVLFGNRTIYYFIWYFLIGFSIAYLYSLLKKATVFKAIFLLVILSIGIANYYTNFYGDFIRHHDRDKFYSEMTQEFLEEDIKYVYLYGVWNIDASVYCYADNAIEVGMCLFDNEHLLLKPFPSPIHNNMFDEEHLKDAYILFSERELNQIQSESEDYEKFFSKMEFVKEKKGSGRMDRTIQIYKAKEDVFYRGNE